MVQNLLRSILQGYCLRNLSYWCQHRDATGIIFPAGVSLARQSWPSPVYVSLKLLIVLFAAQDSIATALGKHYLNCRVRLWDNDHSATSPCSTDARSMLTSCNHALTEQYAVFSRDICWRARSHCHCAPLTFYAGSDCADLGRDMAMRGLGDGVWNM